MSLATKTIASPRSDSGHPEAALNSSVLDRMMDAMTSPFLNGRRAESIKNGRKVHPGAFVFSILLLFCLSFPLISTKADLKHDLFVTTTISTENHITL